MTGMHSEPELMLRSIGSGDGDLLFSWLNRLDSLSGKLNTAGPVPRDEHDHWFAERLADPGTYIWIGELHGVPMGQIRLQRDASGAWLVDIFLLPEARGRGLARTMLTQALERLLHHYPSARVVAIVRSDNGASHRLFKHMGFHLDAKAPDHSRYVYNRG